MAFRLDMLEAVGLPKEEHRFVPMLTLRGRWFHYQLLCFDAFYEFGHSRLAVFKEQIPAIRSSPESIILKCGLLVHFSSVLAFKLPELIAAFDSFTFFVLLFTSAEADLHLDKSMSSVKRQRHKS